MTNLDSVRAYRERLLDLVVNRSDVRMDGAVQYVPRGKETLEIFDAALAELKAVIERQGKELERLKAEHEAWCPTHGEATKWHEAWCPNCHAAIEQCPYCGYDCAPDAFVRQRVTEGGDHD